jgi:hypothetical protein
LSIFSIYPFALGKANVWVVRLQSLYNNACGSGEIREPFGSLNLSGSLKTSATYDGKFIAEAYADWGSCMGELVGLIVKFGWPTVLIAALLLIVLRGQISFRYPRNPQ